MKIIKLSQQGTIERQGEFGWEPETIYEPVYIVAEHIESFSSAGNTYLKMVSGERIVVRETPEQILALIDCDVQVTSSKDPEQSVSFPPSGYAMSTGAIDVLAERTRQVSGEGWTLEHDDRHEDFQLSIAAACYAQNVGDFAGAYYQPYPGKEIIWSEGPEPEAWPWSLDWWNPSNPRRDLVKAGALIIAEIDRLDRLLQRSEAAQ